MKKRERSPEELGGQWLNAMCDVLVGGALAGVTAVLACAFYQLAGFACREASLRWFLFFGDLAVPFSLAALADGSGNWGETLARGGCAMVLTVFLVLRRAEPQPEPAEESGKDTEDE